MILSPSWFEFLEIPAQLQWPLLTVKCGKPSSDVNDYKIMWFRQSMKIISVIRADGSSQSS